MESSPNERLLSGPRCRGEAAPALVALIALATVLPAGRLSGQPASDAPKVSASAEVSILDVDVVVTGTDGRPVHGLTAKDFEVLLGGKPVAITNFREERDPAPTAGGPAQAAPAGPTAAEPAGRLPRRVVVFVDRLYLPEPDRRRQLFDGLKEFLERSLGPRDEAMIVSWGDTVRVVRSFTGDLEQLEATIDAVARRAARRGSEAAELDELAARDFWFQDVEAASGGIPDVDTGSTDLSRELAALQAYNVMKAKTTALRGLVALMAGMEGRKSLVVVADHFGRYPGREFYVGPRGAQVGMPRERDARPLLDELAEAANASGVTLYGIYPYDRVAMVSAADSAVSNPGAASGVYGAGLDAIWSNEMAGLDFVAGKTGGMTAGHPGELPRFLDRVATELGSFYAIGFPASGRAKAAAVTVRVKRPGVEVRTRATVAERTVEDQLGDRVLANLFASDERSRIAISVVAGEAQRNGKKYRIPIEVKIPVGSLVRLPGPASAQGRFSVFVVVATPNGDFSEVTRRRQEFQVGRGDEEKAGASHLTYTLEIESDAPAPRISLGVWDEIGGEAGFALVGRLKG
ncbi:MAG: VWA domain-containing protein [Holophagales bacterium]|nr:VWA domain-containing protein [Holophagales bacterium]